MRRLAAALLLLAIAGCTRRSHFLERSVTIGEHTYRYRVWLPAHYTKLHHWPVILYLHGSGERGDDNVRQMGSGLALALERFGERYKTVAVLPQCRMGEEWYGDMEAQALGALEQTIREFHGDRHRVYLTGVSLGGAGTWYMARHGRKFAAIVPVAGEVARAADDPFPTDPPPDLARIVGSRDPFMAMAEAIGKTPVWAFHGSADDVIPVTQSRSMFQALKQIGGNVRYTEYAGAGHDIADRTYANADLVHWLLSQRLR